MYLGIAPNQSAMSLDDLATWWPRLLDGPVDSGPSEPPEDESISTTVPVTIVAKEGIGAPGDITVECMGGANKKDDDQEHEQGASSHIHTIHSVATTGAANNEPPISIPQEGSTGATGPFPHATDTMPTISSEPIIEGSAGSHVPCSNIVVPLTHPLSTSPELSGSALVATQCPPPPPELETMTNLSNWPLSTTLAPLPLSPIIEQQEEEMEAMQVDNPMGGCSGPDTDPSLVELPPPTAAPSMPSLPTISSTANCVATTSHLVPPIIIKNPWQIIQY